MLTEEGVVIKSSTGLISKALVRTSRSTACRSCASRSSCGGKSDAEDVEIEVSNMVGASVGDEVILGIEFSPLFRVTFLIYILPILSMIFGACLGHWLVSFCKEYFPSMTFEAPILTTFLFLFVSFLMVRVIGKRMSKKSEYKPRIIKIIKRQNL